MCIPTTFFFVKMIIIIYYIGNNLRVILQKVGDFNFMRFRKRYCKRIYDFDYLSRAYINIKTWRIKAKTSYGGYRSMSFHYKEWKRFTINGAKFYRDERNIMFIVPFHERRIYYPLLFRFYNDEYN